MGIFRRVRANGIGSSAGPWLPLRGGVALAVVLAGGLLLAAGTAGLANPGAVAPSSVGEAAVPTGTAASPATATAAAASTASDPARTEDGLFRVPLVPVASFWTPPQSIPLVSIVALWAGAADASAPDGWDRLAVPAPDEAALARAFDRPPSQLVVAMTVTEVKAAVRGGPRTLGLLRPEDVTPDVRSLAVDDQAMFGSERLAGTSRWPLMAFASTPSTFPASERWTVAAGGDVNFDRDVWYEAIHQGQGVDYPWQGGTARLGPGGCCANGVWPDTAAAGPGPGADTLLRDADLALVNLEGPVSASNPDHYSGYAFGFDPRLLEGLTYAGVDGVTLANNHMRDSGDDGLFQTCARLDQLGIQHAGAGANLDAARKPAWFSVNGERVALLAYSAIDGADFASSTSPGVAELEVETATADIEAAKSAGAYVVIVMPHWGSEYTYSIGQWMKDLAAPMAAAGADLILGSHYHWVGGLGTFPGPRGDVIVDYSMGDLLFTLYHDAESQLGEIATATFVGTRVVQFEIRPTVIIGGAQVGLLAPATDGRPVLEAIREASRQTLGW